MSRRLGILGGGQLGGFLCQAAQELDITTTVLTPSEGGYAEKFADHTLIASFDDQAAIDELMARSDVVTFELEDIPTATLHKLAQQTQVEVFPKPDTMLLLQNKGLQKDWLAAQGFPTPKHLRFDQGLDAQAAMDALGPNFVIKTQRGGYDGLGVKLVKNGDVPKEYASVPTIAEATVEDFVEIAVLVARDANGHHVHFPVFQSNFDEEGNVLRRVICPASIDEQTAERATTLACEIIDRLGGVGVFAVECFLTDTDLMINEIAPRVHNVGHLTIEASNASQFAQHVRAVMGLPLTSPLSVVPSVMDNLLYEAALADACAEEKRLTSRDDVTVHWYGKSEPRPLRKMGHLTVTSNSIEQAAKLADQSLQSLRQPA